MEIQFSKLYIYKEGASTEIKDYWKLPYDIYVLYGDPERPIEDWHHAFGYGALWFIFDGEATVTVEFIDPDGLSRGKSTRTLTSSPGVKVGWSTVQIDFDKVGIWKLKGTASGVTETWDALNVLDVEEPPPPPPPPPDPIQNVLSWNPYTAKFEEEFIDVEQGKAVGVKFTVENILEHTYNFRAVIHMINSAGSSQRFDSVLVPISPGGKHDFECKKLDGWQTLGLCTANINIYEVTQYYSHLRWSYLGAPIASIVQEAPPPPPPEEFSLEITQYQRI